MRPRPVQALLLTFINRLSICVDLCYRDVYYCFYTQNYGAN